jgi:hypothetical protein
MGASAWSLDVLAGAVAVADAVSVLMIGSSLISRALVDVLAVACAVSVLTTGSRLISCVFVETTEPVRVLFRFKPAHVLVTSSGVGVVFFAAGLRSSSFKGQERSCLFLGRSGVGSSPLLVEPLATSCNVRSALIIGSGLLSSSCTNLRPALDFAAIDAFLGACLAFGGIMIMVDHCLIRMYTVQSLVDEL